jgi:hypothetical protein
VNVTVRYHGIVGDMLRRKTQEVELPATAAHLSANNRCDSVTL